MIEKGNVEASVGMAIGAGFFDDLVALPGVFSGGEPRKRKYYIKCELHISYPGSYI